MATSRVLPLLTVLLLAACTRPPAPPVSGEPRLLTDAEILAAFIQEPERLPEVSEASYGPSARVSGRVDGWNAQYVRGTLVRLRDRAGSVQGSIDATGRYTLDLPEDVSTFISPVVPLPELMNGINRFEPCAVTTLRVDPPSARGVFAESFVNIFPDAATTLRPALSPPPSFVPLFPRTLASSPDGFTTVQLLHVDRDATVRGERKCMFRWVVDPANLTQYNLATNLVLRRGWNVVTLEHRFEKVNGRSLVRMTLAAKPDEFTPVPAAP